MRTPLVWAISDPHVGGHTAIAPPPPFVIDDGQPMYRSAAQEWLGARWDEMVDAVKRRAVGRKLVLFLMGDLIDGNHHRTTQSLPNLADQRRAARELFEPIVGMADRFGCVRGTEVHAGIAGQDEVEIAQDLGAEEIAYQLLWDVNGVLYDVAHHGRAGTRPWTTGMAGVVSEVITDCVGTYARVPRWVLRGHTHVPDDTGDRFPTTRGLIVPCWQLKTAHAWRVATQRSPAIGYVLIDGERADIVNFWQQPRSVRRIEL